MSFHQLAAEPPLRPRTAPGPTPSRATGLASSRDASAQPRSPGRPPHAQLQPGHELPRRRQRPMAVVDGRLQQRRPSRPGHGQRRRQYRQRAAGRRSLAGSAPRASSPSGRAHRSLAVADFNNDGNLDLATTTSGTTRRERAAGQRRRHLPAARPDAILPRCAAAVAVADFNGDGNMDLVLRPADDRRTSAVSVEVLLGDGAGRLRGPDQYQLHGTPRRAGGRRPERRRQARRGHGEPVRGPSACCSATGTAAFAVIPATSSPPAPSPSSVAVGDFTSDGIPDLVTAGLEWDMAFCPATATARSPPRSAMPPPATLGVAAADFNGDGRLDVVTVWGDPDHGYAGRVLLGRGTGRSWTSTTSKSVGSPSADPGVVVAGDFNGDGRPDVAFAATTTLDGRGLRCCSTTATGPRSPRRCGSTT